MTDESFTPDDLPEPADAANIVHNPTQGQLLKYSSHLDRPTEYGSPSYISEYKSRSSDHTRTTVDHDIDDSAMDELWDDVGQALDDEEMVCVDVRVGEDSANAAVGRYFVPKDQARIALSLTNLMEPVEADDPDFYTVQLPDRDELEIVADPETGTTVVSGSDYTGEAKKSFLRQFMYDAKQQGGLGVHAGAKRVTIEDGGELREVGQVYQGLSGTGKSTLTGHGFWLDEPESAEMIGDDVGALMPTEDGLAFNGSEGRGLYIKTNGLDDEQPELYDAATSTDAVLENVAVEDGEVDFDAEELPDGSRTSNGRAVVLRDDLASASEDINMGSVDQYFFITRNPYMAPITRLDDEQAAATFMLGESVETGAADPDSRGEAVRVVGVNPFIMGSRGAEGNRFHELIADDDVETYLLNTGTVAGRDIGVTETVSILEAVTRGEVSWQEETYEDPDGGEVSLEVPDEVPGLDVDEFLPEQRLDDFEEERQQLLAERRAYLERFDDLDEAIVNAVY
ncbi:MAG: phosphoenolpyruvate carboxykinase [Candidatus Nanohaloarchaea archaeon]|nr:phosphoenolpyruvate carboxykinase [Candidatus Nanohaloarchaea archaeon]